MQSISDISLFLHISMPCVQCVAACTISHPGHCRFYSQLVSTHGPILTLVLPTWFNL